MGDVRYRVLGTTQALRPDGDVLNVGGPRLRTLLTALALRPGRTVPVTTLVDEVWGADLPADAPAALQALVGRLRRALGPEHVASVNGGYQLCAEADQIDVHRFERLAREGARALADGDPDKAAPLLAEALDLWREPALADLPDRDLWAPRWEALREEAARHRLAASVALGDAEWALPELTALCEARPLDEPLQALRLRALRDTGRTAAALADYERLRRELLDRLGTDPGAELRALHQELLRAEAPVEAPLDVGAPPPGNLRARLTSFVGRQDDLRAVREDLGRARLVTLLGPGGAGKTRLSQEVADGLVEAPADGVWLVELAPVDDPEAVPGAVLSALGARDAVLRGAGAEELRAATERQGQAPLNHLIEHCATRRMLLILDNCEHLVTEVARLVESLLEHCPRLTVLATSREPLGVPGELVRPVEPLPEPMALRLWAERGAQARPGFRVEEDVAAATELVRRLDGLPLAIELAAARLRMLTPRQIADRLDDRFRLLSSGAPRSALPRQQTLRSVVDWSWDLLDEDERRALRRLSVFAGGCDLEAAESVCGAGALELLGSLVDKSLVVADPSGAGGRMRYRLLETVAEYASERLREADDRVEAERAHLVHYREMARTTDPLLRGSGQQAANERFAEEYENLRTALRRAVEWRDEQEALCLVLSLCLYWLMRDLRFDARHWSREVGALGPDPFAAPLRRAEPLYERCTDHPPPMRGEVLWEARRGVHLNHMACMNVELESWRSGTARARLERMARAYDSDMPQICWPPSNVWFFSVLVQGDFDRLQEIMDGSIATSRRLGLDWELATLLQLRANLLANRTDWAGDAVRDAEESLAVFLRLDNPWGAAEALSARGEAHEWEGQFERAARDYRQAIEASRSLGAEIQVAVLRARLGNVLFETGQEERGEALLREVVNQRYGVVSEVMPVARLFLATHLGYQGRTAEAREEMRRLEGEFPDSSSLLFEGFTLGILAWLDVLDGEVTSSLELARRAALSAEDPVSRLMAPHMAAVHLSVGALGLARLGVPERVVDGARVLGAVDARLPPGHYRSRSERRLRSQAEEEVRARLDPDAYRAAYAEGGGLTVGQAAALL
ncbi:BTAD domain-containing putative transcriptional regulator [Streptomyces sp. NPDC005438]|uniref:ATP-binding protein n=1 Tax=Streptomyces sp. NPDC005438 TaxID=3156880 RepID=UPI0033AF1830